MFTPRFKFCRALSSSVVLFYFWLTLGVASALSMRPDAAAAWPQSTPPASGNSQAEGLTPPPVSLTIQPPAIMIVAGEPQRLRLIDDRGRPVPGAVWTVSEPARADIKVNGEVMLTGLAPGVLIVTATWQNLKAQAKVTVLGGSHLATVAAPDAVGGLRINPVGLGMRVGQSSKLHLTDSQGHPIQGAAWTVSDPTRAKISAGGDVMVTALAPGSVTVTATWRNLTARAKVTVMPNLATLPAGEPAKVMTPHEAPISPDSMDDFERFEVTPYIVNMVAGDTHRLRVWDNALGQPVTDAEWTVSDTALATIEGGTDAIVSSRAPGKVTVTATWQGHQTDALVTVYPGAQLPVGSVIWSLKPHPGHKNTHIVPAVPH
jgi:hypothetical protein